MLRVWVKMIGWAFFGYDFHLPIANIIKKEDHYLFSFEVSVAVINFFNLLQFKDNEKPPKLTIPKEKQPQIFIFQKAYPIKNVTYLSYTPPQILVDTGFLDEPTEYSQRHETFQERLNVNKALIKEKRKSLYKLTQNKKEYEKQRFQDLEKASERTKERLSTAGRYEFKSQEGSEGQG